MSARLIRIAGNAFVLASINLAGMIAGYVLYKLTGQRSQAATQIPFAVLFTLYAFALWAYLTRSRLRHLSFAARKDAVWIYAAAILFMAAIFVPLHYFTQGYLTAWDNVLGLWGFQLVVNAAAVAMASAIYRLGR